MAESWMAWTILFVLVVGGFYKLICKAIDERNTRDYDEPFNGYENERWGR